MGRGPIGSGMEETYQLTSALKHLDGGKHIALITDGRFSGVSTGACIGHVSPEALAGGPLGKVREGDMLEIVVDRNNQTGSVNFIGTDASAPLTAIEAARVLDARDMYPGLAPDPALPDDTRLWAALQSIGGGSWGGSVYDTDAILRVLRAGEAALKAEKAARQNYTACTFFTQQIPGEPLNTFDLSGKTAIVTGGASGIGKAISQLFAAHGASGSHRRSRSRRR